MSKDNKEFPSFLESNEGNISLAKALQNARIKAELSVDEVATKLNLGVSIILDIENNLDNILESQKYPVIYLRGYLSNYAKLVFLKNLENYTEYQLLNSAQKQKQTLKSSSLIMPRTKKRSKKWPFLLFILLVIAASAYHYQAPLLKAIGLNTNSLESLTSFTSENELKENLTKKVLMQTSQSENTDNVALNEQDKAQNDDTNFSKEVNETSVTQPDNDIVEEAQISQPNIQEAIAIIAVNDSASSEPDEIQTTEVVANDVINDAISTDANDIVNTEIISGAEVETSVDAGPESLSLQFNGECWTEVYDATGERIAFGLYSTGRQLSLTGIAPFKLKLGDPSAVEIQYQDKIIEGEFTPGRSAQFTVPLS